MELELVRKKTKYDGYNSWEGFELVKPSVVNKHYVTISDALVDKCRSCITTCVRQPALFRRGLHLLAADCDSRSDMQAAYTCLSADFRVEVIQSSPERYWLITDQILTWPEIKKALEYIPGVDRQFVHASIRAKRLAFRAFPKNAGYPKMGSAAFQDRLAREWLEAFREYYNSWYFEQLEDILCK